jgi:hypothetical protein
VNVGPSTAFGGKGPERPWKYGIPQLVIAEPDVNAGPVTGYAGNVRERA